MIRRIILLSFALFAQVLYAATDTDLINRLNQIKTMQGNFTQVVHSARGKTLQTTKGSLAIARPGRFRWTTKAPNQQIIIADGKYIWIYDVDLEQVSKKPQQDNLKGSPAAFLSGDSSQIHRDYMVKNGRNGQYLLFPKSNNGDFKSIELIFSEHRLSQMKLTDGLGQTTELSFYNVRVNHSFSKNLFQFTVPQGVDVLTD